MQASSLSQPGCGGCGTAPPIAVAAPPLPTQPACVAEPKPGTAEVATMDDVAAPPLPPQSAGGCTIFGEEESKRFKDMEAVVEAMAVAVPPEGGDEVEFQAKQVRQDADQASAQAAANMQASSSSQSGCGSCGTAPPNAVVAAPPLPPQPAGAADPNNLLCGVPGDICCLVCGSSLGCCHSMRECDKAFFASSSPQPAPGSDNALQVTANPKPRSGSGTDFSDVETVESPRDLELEPPPEKHAF